MLFCPVSFYLSHSHKNASVLYKMDIGQRWKIIVCYSNEWTTKCHKNWYFISIVDVIVPLSEWVETYIPFFLLSNMVQHCFFGFCSNPYLLNKIQNSYCFVHKSSQYQLNIILFHSSIIEIIEQFLFPPFQLIILQNSID